MKVSIDNLGIKELMELRSFLNILIKFNGNSFIDGLQIVNSDNNWIVRLNNSSYISNSLSNVINQIIKDNYEYNFDLLNNNIPDIDMQGYIDYLKSNKSR